MCMLKNYLNRQHGRYKTYEWIRLGGVIALGTITLIWVLLYACGVHVDHFVPVAGIAAFCLLLGFTFRSSSFKANTARCADTVENYPKFTATQIGIVILSLISGIAITRCFGLTKIEIGTVNAGFIVSLSTFCIGLAISRYPEVKAQVVAAQQVSKTGRRRP